MSYTWRYASLCKLTSELNHLIETNQFVENNQISQIAWGSGLQEIML